MSSRWRRMHWAAIIALATASLLSDQPSPPATQPAPASGLELEEERVYNELLTRRTEEAIEQRLRLLEKTQNPDGFWGPDDSYKVANTSLAMVAFMMKGHFPDEKPYGDTLRKGLDALLRENKASQGYMGRIMYEHGFATLALSELWGHTSRDEEVRDALKRAVKVILSSQNASGGWRYNPTPNCGADVSVTVMMTIALASAREAGIMVPDKVIDDAIQYVELCFNEIDGGFAYQPALGPSGHARSSAAIVSLMMCGRHDTEFVNRGVKYVLGHADEFGLKGKTGHYGCYYGAIATYKAALSDFRQWYPKIRNRILGDQPAVSGEHAIYGLAMEVIVLSMPYGFVPAYQR